MRSPSDGDLKSKHTSHLLIYISRSFEVWRNVRTTIATWIIQENEDHFFCNNTLDRLHSTLLSNHVKLHILYVRFSRFFMCKIAFSCLGNFMQLWILTYFFFSSISKRKMVDSFPLSFLTTLLGTALEVFCGQKPCL